jgi:hypothetical protein
MAGLANEAFEPENTSDELSAIKYNTKDTVCKYLFRFFVTKNIVYFREKKEKVFCKISKSIVGATIGSSAFIDGSRFIFGASRTSPPTMNQKNRAFFAY